MHHGRRALVIRCPQRKKRPRLTTQEQNRESGKTADEQKENKADRELTPQIRKSLVDDKTLSMYAHNVKIIAINGVVKLRGSVRSEEERTAVEAKAKAVAGVTGRSQQTDGRPEMGLIMDTDPTGLCGIVKSSTLTANCSCLTTVEPADLFKSATGSNFWTAQCTTFGRGCAPYGFSRSFWLRPPWTFRRLTR